MPLYLSKGDSRYCYTASKEYTSIVEKTSKGNWNKKLRAQLLILLPTRHNSASHFQAGPFFEIQLRATRIYAYQMIR